MNAANRLQLSCIVQNIFSYTDTVMGSGLFMICICVMKTDAVSATDAELLALSCGSVFPWLPLLAPPHPSSPPHQCGCYLFTQYLLLLHSSRGWIMAIFPRVKQYCKAHILKISICRRGRRVATDLRDQRVHTAPQRSWTETAEARPARLDGRTELWVEGIQMQRGPSALNSIKGFIFFIIIFF